MEDLKCSQFFFFARQGLWETQWAAGLQSVKTFRDFDLCAGLFQVQCSAETCVVSFWSFSGLPAGNVTGGTKSICVSFCPRNDNPLLLSAAWRLVCQRITSANFGFCVAVPHVQTFVCNFGLIFVFDKKSQCLGWHWCCFQLHDDWKVLWDQRNWMRDSISDWVQWVQTKCIFRSHFAYM